MNILKTSMAAVIIACSTLAGCNGTPTQAQLIADVQSAAVLACGVEPAAESIAALLTAANAGAAAANAIAAQIASKICSAVATSTAASTKVGGASVPAPVVIDGITVTFEPVKK